MADTKISALTVATTPLAGTEVLPIVQSGVTKQVSVADLTAGRAVSAASLTLTTASTAANGGTGQSSYAVGDLLYASTATALSKLADVATGNALISGGVGVAPSWGKIGLTTHVSGTLGTTNGGTGLTSFTANGILYASSTSALATSSSLTWSGTVFTATGGGGAKAKLQDNSLLLLNSGAIASGFISFQRSDGTQKAAIGSYYNVANEGGLEFIGPTGSTNAMLFASGGFSIGNTTDPGATNLSVTGSVTATNVFATSGFYAINASTATTVASGISFLAVVRCRGSGGSAVILYENNTTPVIISQTGTVSFTTGAPGANQIQIADGGSSITAKSGSSVGNNNLNITVIKNQ